MAHTCLILWYRMVQSGLLQTQGGVGILLQLGSVAASTFALSLHSLSSASILDVPFGKGAGAK